MADTHADKWNGYSEQDRRDLLSAIHGQKPIPDGYSIDDSTIGILAGKQWTAVPSYVQDMLRSIADWDAVIQWKRDHRLSPEKIDTQELVIGRFKHWMKVTLSQKDITAGRDKALTADFVACFDGANRPRDAAMFRSKGRNEPFYYWFSPGAVRIAEHVISPRNGVACSPPAQSETVLVAGSSVSDTIPFADSRSDANS